MDEYRLKVTVRNNLILSAIENQGFKSQSDFARSAGMTPQEVTGLVSFRVSPLTSEGEFRESAKKIMEALGACPSELWTDEQLNLQIDSNSAERTVSQDMVGKFISQFNDYEMNRLSTKSPEDSANESMVSRSLQKVVTSDLSDREQMVIRMRFTNDMSQEEVAKRLGVHKARISQIEIRALWKLKNHKNAKLIDALADTVRG